VAIKPIGDRLLVEVIESEVDKVGSLYVPDTAKERPQQGKVIATGDGKKDGKDIVPMTVKAGDKVLFGKYSGTEVKYDGKEYLILSETDVLAVID
jgi:chaperonin GroES